MKKRRVAGTAAAGGIVAVCLFLGGQFGLNFGGGGTGSGQNAGNAGSTETIAEQDGTSSAGESQEQGNLGQETEQEGNVNVITIRVAGEQVSVNGREYKTPEELRSYLEEVYEDDKMVELVDDQSILAVYEWVQEVLEELEISAAEKTE